MSYATKLLNPADSRFVSAATLAERLDVSRSTIWRWAAEGRIPKPQKFGEGSSRFDLNAVLARLKQVAALAEG